MKSKEVIKLSNLLAFTLGALAATGSLWAYAEYLNASVAVDDEGDEELPRRPLIKRPNVKVIFDRDLGCTVLEVHKPKF